MRRWLLLGLLGLPGCTVFEVANGISPPVTTSRVVGVAYGAEARQKVDVYRGCGVKATDRVPVVVFVHGGGWREGTRGDYAFLARAMAEEGLVVVVPDYGKYPEVVFPTFVRDVARAVAWARENVGHYGGDAERVYVMGHSAGGQIGALVAYDPRYLAEFDLPQSAVAGFVGLSGPYDFTPRPDDVPVFGLSGPTTRGSVDPAIEPIEWVSASAPRTLLVQGLADTLIRSDQPSKLAAKLRAAGVEVEFNEYEGVGHVGTVAAFLWPFRGMGPVRRDVVEFVKSRGPR